MLLPFFGISRYTWAFFDKNYSILSPHFLPDTLLGAISSPFIPMARKPLLTLLFYRYDARNRNDGHRQPEIMMSCRPHPPRFVGAHRHTGMPIRFQPRNFLPRMRHEARQSSDKAMTELRHPLWPPACQANYARRGARRKRPMSPVDQPYLSRIAFMSRGFPLPPSGFLHFRKSSTFRRYDQSRNPGFANARDRPRTSPNL